MSRLLQSIAAGFIDYCVRLGHARVRRELLARDDRFLADAGFSRELLQKGVDAWPWRTEELDAVQQADRRDARAQDIFAEAAAELSKYSDAELNDLALSRGSIPHAVRYGRPGIDQPAPDKDDYQDAA